MGNTNVAHARTCDAGGRSSAMTSLPMILTDDVAARPPEIPVHAARSASAWSVQIVPGVDVAQAEADRWKPLHRGSTTLALRTSQGSRIAVLKNTHPSIFEHNSLNETVRMVKILKSKMKFTLISM